MAALGSYQQSIMEIVFKKINRRSKPIKKQ